MSFSSFDFKAASHKRRLGGAHMQCLRFSLHLNSTAIAHPWLAFGSLRQQPELEVKEGLGHPKCPNNLIER
jgi:hypothetical protein